VRSAASAWVVAACLVLGTAAVAQTAAPNVARTDGITPERVQQAASAVQADPLLGGWHTERKLKFKSDDKAKDEDEAPKKPKPADATWVSGFAQWLAESGRLLMWVAGAFAVVMLLVSARRWFFIHGGFAGRKPVVLPSHVRDLDIRPESLPDDIAGAARAMWLRGEHRPALSLLYRGALSRLVHDHAVPIRAASTEGDCVTLARRVVGADAADFFEQLVQAWLLLVYGARTPDEALVMSLCDRFDARLPAAPKPAGGKAEAAA
jgi:hypothetical protein